MFSVVKAVLIEPLPYPESHRLVWGWGQFERGDRASVSPADFLDYRAETRSFAELSASTTFSQSMNLVGGDRPERVRVAFVAANYFDVLRVAPAIGRAFEARDEDESSPSVAVLSNGLWQRAFGGAPDAVGKTVRVGGDVLTIVGVMPAGVALPRRAEMWAPIPFGAPILSVPRCALSSPDRPSATRRLPGSGAGGCGRDRPAPRTEVSELERRVAAAAGAAPRRPARPWRGARPGRSWPAAAFRRSSRSTRAMCRACRKPRST